jgi:hypothetical protein
MEVVPALREFYLREDPADVYSIVLMIGEEMKKGSGPRRLNNFLCNVKRSIMNVAGFNSIFPTADEI